MIPIDADQIAAVNLIRCQKVGHGINHVALNGAFQMARSVTLIRAFLEEEIAACFRDTEKELSLSGLQDALLHHGEFDVENLL